jgi:Protein of unknown function (DUF2985)
MPSVRSVSIVKGEIDPDNRHRVQSVLESDHDDDVTDQHDLEHYHSHNTSSMIVPSSPTRETTATTTGSDEEDDSYEMDMDDEDIEANHGQCLSSSSSSRRASHAFELNGEGSTLDNIEVLRNSNTSGLAVTASAAATTTSSSTLKRSGVDLYLETLHPPPSQFERKRDALLRFLDTPFVQALGVLVLLLVIVDGALFFFFLMGWQTLCHEPSRTDCEPRNGIYNASIQVLTGLFTIMTVISLPWRWTQASHAFGVLQFPKRRNDVGHDMYGVPSHDVWYHIPLGHRRGIVTLLLLNCFTQYLNQAARIVFNSYEDQSTFPGTLFVNVFFAASFICAFAGGVYMAIISERVRRRHPERFGPGPIQIFLASRAGQALCRYVGCCACCCCGCDVQVAKIEVEALEREIQEAVQHDASIPYDPTSSETRVHPLVRRGSRTELRMFAM